MQLEIFMRTIPEREDLLTEFKSDKAKLSDTDIIDAVVGLTNTKGGVLYLGVEDDGMITGVHDKHKDPIGVCALIANKTVPSVSVRAELVKYDNKYVLEIDIPMSRAIVSSSEGKILRRRLKLDGSPENIPMYPYEINVRLSELGMLDYSAQILPDATIDDFDPNERSRLRNIIRINKGEIYLLELDDEELYKALCFVKEENGQLLPTVTGMLMIGKENRISELLPTAKSSFQVLEGTAVRVNEQYCKPLLATFEIFESNMKAWNPEREMDYGLLRIPIPEFSEMAFREGLVNAFCHRDYTILQMVRVAVEDDGLTISSPGGFIEGVNLANLLTVEPHGRNPALADVFKLIGLAERTGRGIDRIFEGSIVFGRPLPDYSESTSSYVKLFIQRAKPDIPFARMIADEENRTGRSLSINSLLILSALRTSRRVSMSTLLDITHISASRLRATVENLVECGLVEAIGNGRNREYMLSAAVYKRQGNAAGYVLQSDIDGLRAEELVLKLMKQHDEGISRDDVINLLHVNHDQAYRILRKMVRKGLLVLSGRGKYARYRFCEKAEKEGTV